MPIVLVKATATLVPVRNALVPAQAAHDQGPMLATSWLSWFRLARIHQFLTNVCEIRCEAGYICAIY